MAPMDAYPGSCRAARKAGSPAFRGAAPRVLVLRVWPTQHLGCCSTHPQHIPDLNPSPDDPNPTQPNPPRFLPCLPGCSLIRHNPAGVSPAIGQVVIAAASWREFKCEGLRNELSSILCSLRDKMIEAGAWQAILASMEPPACARLMALTT